MQPKKGLKINNLTILRKAKAIRDSEGTWEGLVFRTKSGKERTLLVNKQSLNGKSANKAVIDMLKKLKFR